MSVIPVPAKSPKLPVVYATGANRGAIKSQDALETISSNQPIELQVIDPVAGRATRLADAARKRGLRAMPVEARLEDHLAASATVPDLNILQADRATAIVAGIDHAELHKYPLLGLLLVDAPRFGLTALMFMAGATESAERARLRALFAGIAAVSSRDGSTAIFGADATPERVVIENRMRAAFSAFIVEHAPKLLSGVEPSGPYIEATIDGGEPRPVAVIDGDVLEEEPSRVAERVIAERHFTPRRGRSFLTIEVARNPEPAVRLRSGIVRRDHLLQVGRPRDITLAEADEQARQRLALSRTEPTATQLDMAAVLGLALAASVAGVATPTFPLTTTD